MRIENIVCLYNPILHRYECGNRSFEYFETSIIAAPYTIEPTKGEHDYQTCEGCLSNKKKIEESLKERERKFPLCCDYHKRLLEINGFNVSLYKNSACMCADKVIFTYQHILNNQDSNTWQNDIKQYLNYVIDSFGCFPEGFGEPLFLSDFLRYLVQLIDNNTDIRLEVKEYVHSYVEQLYKPRVKGDPIKLLIDTYNRWLKLFPFNISVFSDLRETYANKTPLLITQSSKNPYSSIVRFNLITPEELIEFLCGITKKLFEDVSDSIMTKIEPIYAKYYKELIQQQMIVESHLHSSSLTYAKIINNWLSSQKMFTKELMSVDNLTQTYGPDLYADDSYKESLRRVKMFKSRVENNGLARMLKNNQNETQLQDMLHLSFGNTNYSVDREVNNGRGPADFKVSMGSNDCTIIETKLANSSKLKQNLKNQVAIYCNANNTVKSITLIAYFNDREKKKVDKVLKELELNKKENYILVNCEYDLPSASNVK